jgi:hypothetical protein
MPINDWIDVPVLRLISKHTIGSIAGLLSYVAVSRLVEWTVGPGLVRDYIVYSDQFILGALFLYFIVTIGYDLLRAMVREIKRNAG